MKKCKFCGADVSEGNAFCSTCGAKTDETPAYEAEVKKDSYNKTYSSATKPVREINVAMLIWSIVNIILGSCTCAPFILGVIGIVFTILAKDAATDEKAKQYIKIAKVINIITSILIVLSITISMIILIVEILSEVPYHPFFY